VTQGETLTVPCLPTLPDINVTLWRETAVAKQIYPDKYVTFNPKVRGPTAVTMDYFHTAMYICRYITGSV
jgi:hypothetical protein